MNAFYKQWARVLWVLTAIASACSTLTWAAPTSYTESEIASVRSERETKIQIVRENEIHQHTLALKRRAPLNRMGELYFRLAELYFESYEAEFLWEGRVHDARITNSEAHETQAIDRKRSHGTLRKAIKACEELLKLKLPIAEREDQIIYYLAHSYDELGNTAQSRTFYSRLIKQYPKSRFAAESYRKLGQMAFDRKNYVEAESHYRAALGIKNLSGDFVVEVNHKLAWVLFRQGKAGESIRILKDALRKTLRERDGFVSVREEMLRDLAIFTTHTGQQGDAVQFLSELARGDQEQARLLFRLAGEFERNRSTDLSALIYEALLDSKADPDLEYPIAVKLVDLDLRRGAIDKAIGRMKNISAPSKMSASSREASETLKGMIRRTAVEQHSRFRSEHSLEALRWAEALYTILLERFIEEKRGSAEAAETRMALAEVKTQLGKPVESAQLYKQVLDGGDDRYAKEAGVLWVESLSSAIKRQEERRKTSDEVALAPSAEEEEFINAADDLQDAAPGTFPAREASLRSAQILAAYPKRHQESIDRSRRIIKKWPESTHALVAGRLWLQLLGDRMALEKGKDDDAFEDASDDFNEASDDVRENQVLMATDAKNGGDLARAIESNQVRASAIQIGHFEARGNHQAVGKAYEKSASLPGRGSDREQAYFDALLAYLRASDWTSVDRVMTNWQVQFPESARINEGLRTGATLLFVRGEFARSALWFSRLGQRASDAASFITSARIEEGIGASARAILASSLGVELLQKTGSAQRWTESLEHGLRLERLGKAQDAVSAYRRCLEGAGGEIARECGVRMADALVVLGHHEQAKEVYRRVISGTQSTTSAFVAHARFRLAEIEENSLTDPNEALPLPEGPLSSAIEKRTHDFETLSRSYLSAGSGGGPWAVAALGRLALWSAAFVDQMERVTLPADWTAERAARLKKTLLSVSQPLKKKAQATAERALRLAMERDLLTPSVGSIGDFLGLRTQGARGPFRLSGVAPDGGQNGRAAAIASSRAALMKNLNDAPQWLDYGNLLWGEQKPGLAEVAYDQAIRIQPSSSAPVNNKVVVALNEGAEKWDVAQEAQSQLKAVLAREPEYGAAAFNLAMLENYYRIYGRAQPLWQKVLKAGPNVDAADGLGVSLLGLKNQEGARRSVDQATAMGASPKRFSVLYHRAAFALSTGQVANCRAALSELIMEDLVGFERESVERLKVRCAQ